MASPPPQPRRVLVVDDDEAKRYTISRPLTLAGIRVEEATTGAQALELARTDPDLIILDVKLPDLSGFDVCEKLKADRATVAIPVLYVSAVFRTSEDRVRGLRGGADGYLVTPINRDELLATVEVWLRFRAAERERKKLVLELDRERAFLEQVLGQLPVGVIIADAPQGRVLFSNAVARRTFGELDLSSPEEYAKVGVRTRDGRVLEGSEYPLARALGGATVTGETLVYPTQQGERILEVNAAPVNDAEGGRVGAGVVFVDVTERKRDEERLRQLSQLREELIGIIGHDLRNPLQAIKMGLRVLEGGQLAFRQQNAVARIQNSTERIRRMIDDMLDFASARLGGGIQVRPQPTDLVEVVTDAIDELRTVHPGRELVRAGVEMLAGPWDPDRLAQVASNLIGNAVQHSPAGSPVTVTVRREGASGLLEVHNGGTPIPAEDVPQLFSPFRRGANAGAGRSVGLGLYIAQQIVLAHRGRITVESTAEAGTTFRVRLPLD